MHVKGFVFRGNIKFDQFGRVDGIFNDEPPLKAKTDILWVLIKVSFVGSFKTGTHKRQGVYDKKRKKKRRGVTS